jgi:hypothetical protein
LYTRFVKIGKHRVAEVEAEVENRPGGYVSWRYCLAGVWDIAVYYHTGKYDMAEIPSIPVYPSVEVEVEELAWDN